MDEWLEQMVTHLYAIANELKRMNAHLEALYSKPPEAYTTGDSSRT